MRDEQKKAYQIKKDSRDYFIYILKPESKELKKVYRAATGIVIKSVDVSFHKNRKVITNIIENYQPAM